MAAFVWSAGLYAQDKIDSISIDWKKITAVSKTTPTLQLVENPMVRPSSPIHKNTFQALKDLGCDYVRYVPWFPYPRMVVAELKRPTATETFWDFTLPDSTMAAFMEATKGHSVVINFSTTPAWMWKTDRVVEYPDDPYQVSWNYNQGAQLKDTTMKELAGYYGRLISWYTKGGFTDELGKYHRSGHYYKIPYWEVLNEPDLEHNISAQQYTKMYDAIVGEMKKVSPETKFIGMSLAYATKPEYFEYFLDPAHHEPGIPLEGISYHHYSGPSYAAQPLSEYQYTLYEKADGFLDRVRFVESIRKRLAPKTFTTINELGVIMGASGEPGSIPAAYWNLAGSMYAYLFLELTKMGIDVAGESQLVGFPSQFPDVSMMNWENGRPNARYWVLKLLVDNFGPGDKLVSSSMHGANGAGRRTAVISQAFVTKDGKKKLLLINKRNEVAIIKLSADVQQVGLHVVDVATGENPPAAALLKGNVVELKPFAVAVVSVE